MSMSDFKFILGENVLFKNPFTCTKYQICVGTVTECKRTAFGNRYEISPLYKKYGITSLSLAESDLEHYGEFDFTTILPKLGDIVNEMYEKGVKGEIQLNTVMCSVTFNFN